MMNNCVRFDLALPKTNRKTCSEGNEIINNKKWSASVFILCFIKQCKNECLFTTKTDVI